VTEYKDDSGQLHYRYLQQLLNDSTLVALEGQFLPRRISRRGGEGDLLRDDQVLATVPRFVLVGPSGSGKTSQLRHWMVQTARRFVNPGEKQESKWLPFYIDLTQLQEGFQLDDLVEMALIAQGLHTSREDRRHLLSHAVPLLLLDNVDRVRDIRILQGAARLWQPVVRSVGDWVGSEVEGPVLGVRTEATRPRTVLACRTEAVSAYQGWLQGLPLATLTLQYPQLPLPPQDELISTL